MTSKMEMEIVWCDAEMTELQVHCASPSVAAITNIYVTDRLIDNLIIQIQAFLSGQVAESVWKNTETGDNTTACLCLRFINADKLGHVLIEVYMEIDDGGRYSDHHCCFYLSTEIGMLSTFCNSLDILHTKHLGIKAVLNI